MSFSAKQLIKILELNGFVFKRSSGSHHIYFHADKNKTIVVPLHSNKDLPKGTFYAILKQAEIDKNDL